MSTPTATEQAQLRLDLIRRLTAALARSTALEPLAQLAIEHVQPHLPDGAVTLLRLGGDRLRPAIPCPADTSCNTEEDETYPLAPAHLTALRDGQPVGIEDVSQDPRTASVAAPLQAAGICALLDVPLVRDGHLVAVLRATASAPHPWTAHETALLDDVAQHLALAVPAPAADPTPPPAATDQRLRAVLEALPDLLFIMSRDGVFLDYIPSQTAETLVPPDDFLGRHISDLFSPALTQRVLDRYEAVLRTGTPQVIEYNLPEGQEDECYEARLIPFGEDRILSIVRDVSAPKQAERQLRQSEERWRKLVTLNPEAIFVSNAEGRFVYANTAAAHLLGVDSPDAILGRMPFDFAALDEHEVVGTHLQEVRASGVHTPSIYQAVRPDGTIRHVEAHITPITYEGAPAFLSVVRDVTDQRRAEQAMRESQQRLKLALKAARMGTWEWDLASETVHWFDDTEREAAPPDDFFDGRLETYASRIHPDDRDAWRDALEHSAKTGAPFQTEHRIVYPDGRTEWIASMAQVICAEDGTPQRMIGTAQVVTERKRNEAALRESEARYRLLAENATDVITVLNPDLGFTYVSPSGDRILGYTPEEFLRLDPAALLTEESLQQTMHAHRDRMEALAAGQPADHPIRLELRHHRKDGTLFWGENVSIPLRDEAGTITGYLATTRDISERKQTERALIAAKEEAEEMSRLKSAFLANMSHEIRTPLTAVIGFASVLADEVPEGKRELARYIERGGRRLLNTLNSVLDLSMLESGSLKVRRDRLDLNAEVRAKLEMLQPLAQDKQIALEAVVPPYPVYVELDAACLDRILNNLVGNAIKFTDRGSVTVEVTPGTDTATLTIRDTGVGIDEVFLPHLFDAFKQESDGLARSYEGSGLSLTITKHLIDLMGGRIEVTSQKQQGTTFVVRFPYEPGTAQDPVPEPRPCPRLLLVEDEAILPELIRRMLRDQYDVHIARSEEEALTLARQHPFDVVLMDINLNAERTGIDALQALREMPAYAATPIIAVTAYALPGDREQFLEMGFSAYLSKPFTREQLLRTLAEAAPAQAPLDG